MSTLYALLLAFTLSPIWPLGVNPLVGDPYLIVNKQSNQLAYINNGRIQAVYPVATGATADLTPEGEFTIIIKAINPYYRRKNILGGSPDNPLGTRWIGFDAAETDGRIYGVHGTNNYLSIGKYVSNGCVRMHNQDVETLFSQIPLGTRILVVNTNRSFVELGIEHGAISTHIE